MDRQNRRAELEKMGRGGAESATFDELGLGQESLERVDKVIRPMVDEVAAELKERDDEIGEAARANFDANFLKGVAWDVIQMEKKEDVLYQIDEVDALLHDIAADIAEDIPASRRASLKREAQGDTRIECEAKECQWNEGRTSPTTGTCMHQNVTLVSAYKAPSGAPTFICSKYRAIGGE